MTQIRNEASNLPSAARDPASALEHAIDLSSDLFELPTVAGAAFAPSSWSAPGYSQVHLSTSQKSLAALTKRSAAETIVLDDKGTVVSHGPAVSTSDDVKHAVLSHDGSKLAKFRVIPGKDGKEAKRVVEIFTGRGDRKIEEVDVTKDSGDFYLDATFGGPAWHPDGKHLVFVGEAPAPKGSDDPFARPTVDKFRYTPDYGETFTGKKEPTLFLVVLSDSPLHSKLSPEHSDKLRPSVHRLTFPETGGRNVNFGQPVFAGDDLRLLATGYAALGDERKLGIVYCANRPARIYELTLAPYHEDSGEGKGRSIRTTVSPVSPEDRSARSPRVYVPVEGAKPVDGVKAVFISNPLGGPHSSCASLHLLSRKPEDGSWTSKELVASVSSPKTPDGFPGLFLDQLPAGQTFLSLSSGPAIALTTAWRSRRVPIVVSLSDGKLSSLAPWPTPNEADVVLPYLQAGDKLDSIGVFGTDGRTKIVASRSGPTTLPSVVVADLGGLGSLDDAVWQTIRTTAADQALDKALSRLDSTILPLPKFLPSEIILVSPIKIDPAAPAARDLPPLIVYPHGGPHSAYSSDFSHGVASLALAGYRVALVNYPGSTGFGQDFIDVLPPQLGKLEVEATLGAGHYLNTLSLASGTKGKRLLVGGSHGGWILAHLTSKYDEFDAAVMRNPVVDLPSMLASTDIPDWTYEEMEVEYSLTTPPSILTPELFASLHKASPLTLSTEVKTPTMLLVGKIDRRVPPDQARAWYHALKKNLGRDGKTQLDVEMLAFDREGHPITNEVEHEWVAFEQGLRFLAKYTEF
ncbi:hypothetical protein JCM10212_000613 [Sporobolomyces blumeae]